MFLNCERARTRIDFIYAHALFKISNKIRYNSKTNESFFSCSACYHLSIDPRATTLFCCCFVFRVFLKFFCISPQTTFCWANIVFYCFSIHYYYALCIRVQRTSFIIIKYLLHLKYTQICVFVGTG